GRVPLQMLGLGEGQLQLLRQGAGEVVASDRYVPLPDPRAVGDDQVRVVGADVEHDDRVFRTAALKLVEADVVVKRDRAHLHDIDLDTRHGQRQDGTGDLVTLHREEATSAMVNSSSLT